MDGGRIFRSLLSLKLSRLTATRIASGLGQLTALVFIGIAIYDSSYFMLSIIGIFVFLSASGEYRHVKMADMLKKFTAKDLVRTQFTAFSQTQTIDEAKEMLTKDTAGDYVIQDEMGAFRGIITRGSLIRAVKKKDQNALVLEYASNRIATIHTSTNVSELFNRMQEEQLSDFEVRDDEGEFVGIIDMKGMNEFLKYQSQLERRKRFAFLERFQRKQS
jgi:CBS domain-containing protein